MLEQKIEKLFKSFRIDARVKCVSSDENKEIYEGFIYNCKEDIVYFADKFYYISDYLGLKVGEVDWITEKPHTFRFSNIISEEKLPVIFNDEKYDFIFDNDISKPNNIFFGVDSQGYPLTKNIDELPHILVAGTTGSGKSVCVNSIICSLLKSSDIIKPKFAMIDTKIVELSMYKNLPNCQIATNVEQALELLEDIDLEISARYRVMEEYGYKIMPDAMSKLIVVIEEVADLMLSSGKDVEKYIVRIAQLGRACGVHLICSTQRPTVNVLTGLIKANIGCRLALKTTSSVDSRVILDEVGAENLMGKGDCLIKLPTKTGLTRIQCPYISDDDIKGVIDKFINEGGEKI